MATAVDYGARVLAGQFLEEPSGKKRPKVYRSRGIASGSSRRTGANVNSTARVAQSVFVTTVSKAKAPFAPAFGVVADVDVPHAAIVGAVAAWPTFQVRVDARRVASHIDGLPLSVK